MTHRRRRGHFCWCCGSMLANEAFSGRGHARHLCWTCAKLGPAELGFRQQVRNLHAMLDWDGLIRRKAKRALQRYLDHADARVRVYAAELVARDRRKREERGRELDEDALSAASLHDGDEGSDDDFASWLDEEPAVDCLDPEDDIPF